MLGTRKLMIQWAGGGKVVRWGGVNEKAAGECDRKRDEEWWGSGTLVAVASSMLT